ncbi:MAG: PepSY domain-containing protein, partial [Coprobacillaceae bacterium]
NSNQKQAEKEITIEKAKEIALADEDGEIVKEKKDYDDGIIYYEIDIIRDNTKYEFEIDSTGNIVSKEQDTYENNENTNIDYISQEEAKNIIINHAGGGNIVKIELDYENGKAVYEMELIKDNIEYDAMIDANTGEIIAYYQD